MKRKIALTAALLLAALAMAAQSVTLVSPNGNESWALNSAHAITWTFANAGSVKVDIVLRNSGGKVGTIKSNVSLAAGSWLWNMVGKLEDGSMAPIGTDYIVRIRDVANTFGDSSDQAFAIASAAPVIIKFPDHRLPRPLPLGDPKLAVTAINLVRNASGYSVVFGYKNVGNAALPKRHEFTVKPDYRVLIDGREIDKGDLFIPESPPAGPGWELATHSGGFINFPVNEPHPWYIGKQITIILNERNALNIGSASKTSSLLPIVLQVGYDLAFYGPVTIDWNANKASVVITKVGSSPEKSKNLTLFSSIRYYHKNTVGKGGFNKAVVYYESGPRLDENSKGFPITGPFPMRVDFPLDPTSPYYEFEFHLYSDGRDQFDERNDDLSRTRFERPGIPLGPRIHSVSFSTRADTRGKPTQLRTVITLLNEAGHSVGGLRLGLKRDGATVEEWKGISLAAGQKQLYINYGSLPKPYPPAYFDIYLYDGGGDLIDSRSEAE